MGKNKILKLKETNFINEKEGQIRFFQDLKISADVSLTNNTDGVYRGTLFEFKLNISDINKVLFQAIKYLSHLRIKGENIPKTILLVALNEEIAYKFESKYFLKYIEKVYFGAASKNNKDFSTEIKPKTIKYKDIAGLEQLTKILQERGFIKIHIDIYDVVGWTNRFYSENPKATKTALFDELKNPKHFKDLIYAWKGKESDFKYILDLLNDRMHRKELGAFFTPPIYCKKALELVRKAIKQVPKGNDYVIVDRCAGTGNLEEFLTDKNANDITIGELSKYLDENFIRDYMAEKSNFIQSILKKFKLNDTNQITIGELECFPTKTKIKDYLFDNEISHCIVATYELKEWIVLNERIGNKVKTIIPPSINPKNALVKGGDALAIDLFEEIKAYVKNRKCNVILFENPPYRDSSASDKDETSISNKGRFIFEKMKNYLSDFQNTNVSTARDISNQFIWSGWKFYLKKENDCYVLFSPIKYWKSLGLCNKRFVDGFLFNREYFHAGASAISCIAWQNIDEKKENLILKAFDITEGSIKMCGEYEIKKVYKTFNSYFDTRLFKKDIKIKLYAEGNGYERKTKMDGNTIFNKNIIGYLRALTFQ